MAYILKITIVIKTNALMLAAITPFLSPRVALMHGKAK